MRALALVAVACGASTPAPHGAATESITIVDPGSAPRRVVRFAFVVGAISHVEYTAKTSTATAVTNTVLETSGSRQDLPTIRWVSRVVVNGVTGNVAEIGATVVEAHVLDDVVVDARTRGWLQGAIEKARGTTLSFTMTDRGKVSNAANPATPLESAPTIVFPDGEVGVGAVWKVTSRERLAGVMWDQVSTFRLRDLGATQVSIDVEVARRASRQALSVEPTATTTLTSGTAKATATHIVSLGGLETTGTAHDSAEINLAIVEKALRITTTTQRTGAYTSKAIPP